MSDANLARMEHGKYVGVRGELRRDGVCVLRKPTPYNLEEQERRCHEFAKARAPSRREHGAEPTGDARAEARARSRDARADGTGAKAEAKVNAKA